MKRTAAAISDGRRRAFEQRAGNFLRECGGRLVDIGEDRPRTYGVDPDPWREGLCQRLGGCVETGFGDGVGEVVGREPPDPLVDDVDDVTPAVGRQGLREGFGEQHGRAEVDGELSVPLSGVEAVDLVVRGTVPRC